MVEYAVLDGYIPIYLYPSGCLGTLSHPAVTKSFAFQSLINVHAIILENMTIVRPLNLLQSFRSVKCQSRTSDSLHSMGDAKSPRLVGCDAVRTKVLAL